MPYSFSASARLYERAQRSIAGGVNSGIRKMELPVPLYFSHGKGARLTDVDGNEYIDFQLGQGALLFGHAPEGLAEAIAKQARLGTHWAAQSEKELAVAERLQSMIPSAELTRFSNSATEAASAALRVARAHTGRTMVLKFEGHYHGWSDEGLVGFANPVDNCTLDAPPSLHPSKGVLAPVLDQFVVARWNDPEHLRSRVDAFRNRLAGIIFEPVLCNTCCIEPSQHLFSTIRDLCDRDGMLMIADETITGFRFGASCAQGCYSFKPDLSIFGKAIGGGTPFAALSGTREAMRPIVDGSVVHAGTLNANPLCLAASEWCLDQVRATGASHPESIRALGLRLMQGLSALADEFKVPLHPQGPGLVFHTVMLRENARQDLVTDYRDYQSRHDAVRWAHLRRCLLEHGVRAIERGLWSISLAHTAQDIDEALARARKAFIAHVDSWTPA